MRLRNRGSFDPYATYSPGDLFERGHRWFVVDRGGSARPVAAIGDPEADRGLPGPPGKDGQSIVGPIGPAGRDAPQSFQWRGRFKSGALYHPMDCVETDEGSFVCLAETKKEPPSKAWGVLALAGKDGRDGKSSHSTTRIVRENTSSSDIELAFLEDAHAGEAIYVEEGDKCGVANTLSHWRSKTLIGFAVNDTIAGSRGLVRTAGLITVPQTLSPGWNYFLSGRGGLCTSGGGVSVVVHAGVAVRSDTLLIRPEVLHFTRDVLTANGSGPKGAPVYLSGPASVELASMPHDWQVVGVLTEDASGTATFAAIADIVQTDWSAVLEDASTTLTPGKYYLSDVPGKITTESTGRRFIGVAKSTTKLAFGSEGDERTIVG